MASDSDSVTWEMEKQVLLTQLQNILLALRSQYVSRGGYAFSTSTSFHTKDAVLLQRITSMQRAVLSSSPPCVGGATDKRQRFTFSAEEGAFSMTDMVVLLKDLCCDSTTSDAVTSVSLAALVAILDLSSFSVSPDELRLAIEAALNASNDGPDTTRHEVLLSRIAQVLVLAVRHPRAAGELGERVYIDIISRMLLISLRAETSSLLKRTAENAMVRVVGVMGSRIVAEVDPTSSAGKVLTGGHLMRYLSRLISGEVDALGPHGQPISSSTQKVAHPLTVSNSMAAIQLEGLLLAQSLLQSVQGKLHADGDLLRAIQNDLSCALLMAGVSTTQVVVLSQILRTVHLVVSCAAPFLVMQILNFVRVLHLVPLATLAEGAAAAGTGTSAMSPSSRSPASPLGVASPNRSTASTASGSGNTATTFMTAAQLFEMNERRELLLQSLVEFCTPDFFYFCFAHYDLSWRHVPIIPQLCSVLSANIGDGVFATLELDDPAEREGFPSLDRLSSLLPSLTAAVKTAGQHRSRQPLFHHISLLAMDGLTNLLKAAANPRDMNPLPLLPSPNATCCAGTIVHPAIGSALRSKQELLEFSVRFRDSPLKEGIAFLLEHATRVPTGSDVACVGHSWLVLEEPAGGREVGKLLFRLSVVLDKRTLGDHIGDLGKEPPTKPTSESEMETRTDASGTERRMPAAYWWERDREQDHVRPGTQKFYEAQLQGFIHEFDFRGKPLLTSIREMVYRLCLPGESQKIDRVMETFAKHWFHQNSESPVDPTINPFRGDSAAFILSFAMIMLNTDMHSGKMEKRMTLESFLGMNRGIDEGSDVPEAYLQAVYDDIKQHEVIMAEMMSRGFANEITWSLEMHGIPQGLPDFVAEVLGTTPPTPDQEEIQAMSGNAMEKALPSRLKASLEAPLFLSVWHRCLPVFQGLLAQTTSTLMSVELPPSDLITTIRHVRQQYPMETSTWMRSLTALFHVASCGARTGGWGVSDYVVQSLLSHFAPSMHEPQVAAYQFFHSFPSLFFTKCLMDFLQERPYAVNESREDVCRHVLQLYLLDLYSDAEKAEGEASNVVPAAVCSIPKQWMEQQAQRPPRAGGEGVGWFASFFGGAEANAAQEAKQRTEQLLTARAQPRVRECVPTLSVVVRTLAKADNDGPHLWMHELCAASLTVLPDSVEEAVTLRRCVSATLFSGVLALFALQASGADNSRTFLKHSRTVLMRVAQDVGVASSSTTNSPSLPLVSAAQRMTESILHHMEVQMQCLSGSAATDAVRACANVLTTSRLPPSLFSSLVAPSLSAILLTWASRLHRRGGEVSAGTSSTLRRLLNGSHPQPQPQEPTQPDDDDDPSCSMKEVQNSLHAISDILTATSLRLDDHTNADVVARLSHALYLVVTSDGFDLLKGYQQAIIASLVLGSLDLIHVANTTATVAGDGRRSLGREEGDESRSLPSGSGSPAEVLSHCSRQLARMPCKEGPHSDREHLKHLWLLTLKCIGALAMSAAQPRDGSEALLCLQRCVLDADLATGAAAGTLPEVYHEVLFHLTDTLCSPSQCRALPWKRNLLGLCESLVLPTLHEDDDDERKREVQDWERLLADASAFLSKSLLNSSGWPPAKRARERAANGTTSLPPISMEVKCRMITLLPKSLLQQAHQLATPGSLLMELWKKVLATMYALYCAYSDTGRAFPAPPEDASQLVREAVEETVKNMIYVASATLAPVSEKTLAATEVVESTSTESVAAAEGSSSTEPSAAAATTEHSTPKPESDFWEQTRVLLREFDFSKPLLEFIDGKP